MQVFIPYKSPLDCAKTLYGDKRFQKQIIECKQILAAIDGAIPWSKHPVCLMYKEHREWLYDYMCCMDCYLKGLYDYAKYWSDEADKITPSFITDEMVAQHRKRLYTKSPKLYPQFAEYGTSEENWYVINGQIVKYINGKRIN